ncbi:MAG: DEAD/DEAH box helicase [Thermoprotei archaeon]
MPDVALKDWQQTVAEGVLSGKNVLLVAPTGSGKSHLALSLCRNYGRVLWVLPTKALTREWFMAAYRALSAVRRVNIYTGDYRRESSQYEGDVVLATYESALLQLRRKDAWFDGLDLFVIDEFQFMDDDERGGVIEELLILLSEYKPNVQVLALSATIGNPRELARWLSTLFERVFEVYDVPMELRPIRLVQHALKFRSEKQKRRYLFDLIRENPDKQFLVFVPRRFEAESLARYYASLGVKTTVHHAGLDRLSRITAEDSFRNGLVQALFCTATLQYGVNLPAHYVVVYDPVWNTRRGEFSVSVNEYLQMAGRAGRPIVSPVNGKKILEGKVVVLTVGSNEYRYAKLHLLNHEAEPVMSFFETNLVQRVHGLLLYKGAEEIRKLLSKSFAKVEPKTVNNALRTLAKMGFLDGDGLNSVGRFVAELNLNPFIAYRFIRELQVSPHGERFGQVAARAVFEAVMSETSSAPPYITSYQDLLKWRFVEKPYMDGVLLIVNYDSPTIFRDRAAWYMYAYERLSGFLGYSEHSRSIMKERLRLEGLSEYEVPSKRIQTIMSQKQLYIEVAIREYDEVNRVGKTNWMGFDVYVGEAPRGWTEPVRVTRVDGRMILAELVNPPLAEL